MSIKDLKKGIENYYMGVDSPVFKPLLKEVIVPRRLLDNVYVPDDEINIKISIDAEFETIMGEGPASDSQPYGAPISYERSYTEVSEGPITGTVSILNTFNAAEYLDDVWVYSFLLLWEKNSGKILKQLKGVGVDASFYTKNDFTEESIPDIIFMALLLGTDEFGFPRVSWMNMDRVKIRSFSKTIKLKSNPVSVIEKNTDLALYFYEHDWGQFLVDEVQDNKPLGDEKWNFGIANTSGELFWGVKDELVSALKTKPSQALFTIDIDQNGKTRIKNKIKLSGWYSGEGEPWS